MPALGRDVEVSDVYNYNTDTIFKGMFSSRFVWCTKLINKLL